MCSVRYRVVWKRKLDKQLTLLPKLEQYKFSMLVDDLKTSGVMQPNWPNFSKPGENEFHCHLSRKWVACWRWENKDIVIEVYYAGSREKAPY